MSAIVNDIVLLLPQAFVAIVIVVISAAVANAVKDLLTASLGGVSYGPLLAALATVGGILVVGVGGGLIGPMRSRWEGWLNTLDSDTGSRGQAPAGATGRAYVAPKDDPLG